MFQYFLRRHFLDAQTVRWVVWQVILRSYRKDPVFTSRVGTRREISLANSWMSPWLSIERHWLPVCTLLIWALSVITGQRPIWMCWGHFRTHMITGQRLMRMSWGRWKRILGNTVQYNGKLIPTRMLKKHKKALKRKKLFGCLDGSTHRRLPLLRCSPVVFFLHFKEKLTPVSHYICTPREKKVTGF